MKAAWRKWLAAKRAADPAFAKGVSDDAEQVPAWNNAALIAFMADADEAADVVNGLRDELESVVEGGSFASPRATAAFDDAQAGLADARRRILSYTSILP